MEYLGEIIALGIDSVVFAICLKQYFNCKNALTAIKDVPYYEDGAVLSKIVEKSPDKKLDYVAIRGTVKPLGEHLYSINVKDITGVVQKLTVKEHVVARTSAGFWSDQERTITQVHNAVPFVLQLGRHHQVEVLDPLAADILDMDIISDRFEPIVPTFTDHVWGFFTGLRQRGLQSTEEMLRDGAIITGIGELKKTTSKSSSLTLGSPSNNIPFYLTSMSIDSLLKKLDDRRRIYRWLCFSFGILGLIMGGIIARRYWKDRQEERTAEELRQSLAMSRKERRQRVRDKDLKEEQLCVVCRTNPREIILLPCGHVCLCEDCSADISADCPVCRTPVAQRAAAYIA